MGVKLVGHKQNSNQSYSDQFYLLNCIFKSYEVQYQWIQVELALRPYQVMLLPMMALLMGTGLHRSCYTSFVAFFFVNVLAKAVEDGPVS